MIKYVSEINEIEFILSNLRREDKEELENLFGNDWYQKTLSSLKDEKFLILYGQGNATGRVPVAMGGFYKVEDKSADIACVWLLSSRFISQNKTALMRVLKNQLYLNAHKYDILYNFIYKSNYGAKLWLKKLGFNFDNPNPKNIKLKKDFEFFYKTKERSNLCASSQQL